MKNAHFNLLQCFITLIFMALLNSISYSQTLKTDALDYPPGSTVTITGSGFKPGEEVELSVHHADGNLLGTDPEYHKVWKVIAFAGGDFTTS